MSAKESAADKRKREKAEAAEAEAAAAEAAQLEADNVLVAGAVGGPVTPVPENIRSYFDLKMQEILKTISDQFQVITTEFDRSKKETGENMDQLQMDLSTSVNTLQDRMINVEHKKQSTDVDIKVIQKTIRQLPKSGDIQEYFEDGI